MASVTRWALALSLSIIAATVHGYSQSEALTAVGGSREGLLSLVTDPGAYNISIPTNLTSSPGSNYLVDGVRAFQFFYPLVGDSVSFWYGFAKNANGTNKFASSGYLSNATSTNGGTPNTDTVYGSAVVDVTQGPILLYVPPFGASLKFWSLTLYDYYQNVVHVLGSVQHSQSNATYLVLQKQQLHKWLKTPNKPKVAELLYVQYNYTILFTRLLVNTPSDLTAIRQLQPLQKITLYNGKPPRYFLPPVLNSTLRAGPLDPNNTAGGNLAFFSTAGTLLQYHGLPVKGSGIDQILKRFHINPVDGFNLTALNPLQKYALVIAVNLGFAILSAKSLQPYPVSYPPWSVDLDWGIYGHNDLANSFVERYFPIANLPKQTVYYYARTDSTGKDLTGAKGAWNITIPANLPYNPVTAFWSLIVYTYPNGALINNPLNRYEFGDRSQNISYDADKSYTIYLAGTAPTNPKQYANWLPAGNGTIELVLRLYEPTSLVLDGLYAPPAIIPA